MDFSSLPPELQVQYLLKLPVNEILAYCKTSKSAQSICQDPYFWDQKGIQDFGFPFSLLCKMSPYWGYRFIQTLRDSSALVGPLVRSGNPSLIRNFFQRNNPEESAIIVAIETDDLTTLRYLNPKGPEEEEEEYYEDPYFEHLRFAFLNKSNQVIKYLISLAPDYLYDVVILDELLGVLPKGENNEETISILAPYIQEMRKRIPGLYERTVDLPAIHSYLAQFNPVD